MKRYAATTTVPVERSKAELDKLLTQHGATQRGFMNDDVAGTAVVLFSMGGRRVRLEMSCPTVDQLVANWASMPMKRPQGWSWWNESRRRAWCTDRRVQIERQRWRGLILLCKAKLEAIADGQTTVEREFLPDILMPNGQRLEKILAPRIEQAYLTRTMPPLLTEAQYERETGNDVDSHS